MTIYRTGNLLHAQTPDVYVIPTNACLVNEKLVMGAGFAKAILELQPDLARKFGEIIFPKEEFIARNGRRYTLCEDYYLLTARYTLPTFLALQTKRRWDEGSDLTLISEGLERLKDWLDGFRQGASRYPLVYLPFPGVGLGGLKKEEVKPLLDVLPSNVTVWSL